MEALADRQLVLVAGKGGVGKTTTSSALALGFAKMGRKTLLVTVDPAKRLEDSLGIPIGFSEKPIQPNLTALMLDPEAVITEHLEREVPEASITDHPMFRYVTNYLPGLNELMAIGKINDLRREGHYDVIVVDTAPTGHALSFLSAPKAIHELMNERSLIRWALKGYAVWQKLQGTLRGAGNLFKRKGEERMAIPDIDFERIFEDIRNEAERIQNFLTDPERSGFVVVTLPEKLPVEETLDLESITREQLGMKVHAIVANKVQPDVLGHQVDAFQDLRKDSKRLAAMAKAAKVDPELVEDVMAAASFHQLRREMNLEYLEKLRKELPGIPIVEVPLFEGDVHGLKRLGIYQESLFSS